MSFESFLASRFYPEPDKTANGGGQDAQKCHEQTINPEAEPLVL
jgi:hypothetical protein